MHFLFNVDLLIHEIIEWSLDHVRVTYSLIVGWVETLDKPSRMGHTTSNVNEVVIKLNGLNEVRPVSPILFLFSPCN